MRRIHARCVLARFQLLELDRRDHKKRRCGRPSPCSEFSRLPYPSYSIRRFSPRAFQLTIIVRDQLKLGSIQASFFFGRLFCSLTLCIGLWIDRGDESSGSCIFTRRCSEIREIPSTSGRTHHPFMPSTACVLPIPSGNVEGLREGRELEGC